jgi:hypothetical protein
LSPAKVEEDGAAAEEDMSNQARHTQERERSGAEGPAILFFLIVLLLAPQALAKRNVDFNPDLDFSKYKTFAYIGGVEQLEMQQLNPNEIRDNVHEAVARALTKCGLKEVRRDENPDLVARYFANSQAQLNFIGTGDWGGYDPFIVDYWAYNYDLWNATTTTKGSLMIDLIDAKRKDLAWRLLLEQKILNVDKVWEKVNQEIAKAFESYPPTEKEKEEKRKERAEHPQKAQKPQFQ